MKFPEMSRPETLEKKYLGKLSKKAMSFMKACLKMDPKERITAADCLTHPYFEGLNGSSTIPPSIATTDLRIESAKPALITTNNKLSSNPSSSQPQTGAPGAQQSNTTNNTPNSLQIKPMVSNER